MGFELYCTPGPPFAITPANAIFRAWPPPKTSKKLSNSLPRPNWRGFARWFEAFDAAQFDAAIERDARAGKLDVHVEEAVAAHRAGQSRDL